MNFDIILCTKDRFQDCLKFIASFLSQSLYPNNFIVVDASTDGKRLQEECTKVLAETNINLIYIRSSPGLTRQRNLGIGYLGESSQIVFFFDDDIIFLDPLYLENILIRYSKDILNEIGCIFGRIENLPKYSEKPQSNASPKSADRPLLRKLLGGLSRFFLISSRKTYHVLPSGMNTSNPHKTDQECFVKWQPGCCMSFRKEVFNRYLFDETLSGYSMREDLDMSYRVAKSYKILYLPSASLLHAESPVKRLDAVSFGEADVKSWHWFVKKNMSTVNHFWFFWGSGGYIMNLLLSSLLCKTPADYLRAVGGLKALLKIVRHS